MTFDNGKEFAGHLAISKDLDVEIFFADPYSSFQRGTNENMNRQIRRFLPKGTDLRSVTQEELDEIADKLNNRPRRSLNYKTPAEVFSSA
jgi:IS30 family transposase